VWKRSAGSVVSVYDGPTMNRSAPLQRRTPLARGGPLPRESAKTKRERPDRMRVQEVTRARHGGVCEAKDLVPEVRCWGPVDVDEIAPRGRRPGGHLDDTNTQCLCRAHHDWKHAHPRRALELGLTAQGR